MKWSTLIREIRSWFAHYPKSNAIVSAVPSSMPRTLIHVSSVMAGSTTSEYRSPFNRSTASKASSPAAVAPFGRIYLLLKGNPQLRPVFPLSAFGRFTPFSPKLSCFVLAPASHTKLTSPYPSRLSSSSVLRCCHCGSFEASKS